MPSAILHNTYAAQCTAQTTSLIELASFDNVEDWQMRRTVTHKPRQRQVEADLLEGPSEDAWDRDQLSDDIAQSIGQHLPSSTFVHGSNSTPNASHSQKFGREAFLAMVSSLSFRPRELRSPAANQMLLYQTLVDYYLPKDAQDVKPLESLVAAASLSPALSKAMNAASLLVLNRVGKDARLEQQAEILYASALRRTRQELTQPNSDKLVIVGTAHMLTVCELFRSTSLQELGARPHTRWLICYMESSRTDTSNSHMSILMNSNVRLFATWEALISRRSPCSMQMVPDESELQPDGSLGTLSNLAVTVSSVLEKNDKLCQSCQDSSLPTVLSAIEEVVGLEGKLHDWMAAYYTTNPGNLYRTIEATDPSCPLGRATTLLLRRVSDFADMQTAVVHVSFWMCLLMLTEAQLDILNLHRHRHEVDYTEYLR